MIQINFNQVKYKTYLNAYKDRLNGVTDDAFKLNSSLFVPNIGFGIYAYGKRYFIGVAAPHLLPSKLRDKTGVSGYNSTIARMYNHYTFTAGYVFGKEASIVKFRPSILMKWQKGLPHNIPQFDINLALLFVERVLLRSSILV